MNDRFFVWFKGDEDACAFAAQLWDAAQEWDDYEDEGQGNKALLQWLAFGKEYQPFFHAHSVILRPVLLTMYLQWTAANTLDKGDEGDVCKAYMLRAGYYGVLHAISWIIGGDDWARECGPEIYRSYGETPLDIWKEFNHA